MFNPSPPNKTDPPTELNDSARFQIFQHPETNVKDEQVLWHNRCMAVKTSSSNNFRGNPWLLQQDVTWLSPKVRLKNAS